MTAAETIGLVASLLGILTALYAAARTVRRWHREGDKSGAAGVFLFKVRSLLRRDRPGVFRLPLSRHRRKS